jgi:predicted nucleic acid-binding protein
VIVVDAGVVGDALLVDGEAGATAARALAADDAWAAPEHLTIEVVSVLRKHYLRGRLSASRARDALGGLQTLEFERVDTSLLIDRIWELKDNVSAYDAAYVAAAELLEVPLLTGDTRLTTAPGPRCQIITPTGGTGA